MKTPIAILLVLAAVSPAAADMPSHLTADCGKGLVCSLRIEPAGADTWTVEWAASDPADVQNRPLCSFRTTAELGSAMVGDVEVSGIAVGTVRGRPFGIFDLDDGRVSWSSSWSACPGISPKVVYSEVGD